MAPVIVEWTLCGTKKNAPPMSHPLTTLIVSVIYWLDIIFLCWRMVMNGRSFLHVLLTISLPGTAWRAKPWLWVRPEPMHPPGFGKLGCIQETEASAGRCACGLNGYVMWLWLYWCSASAHMLAAPLWAGCCCPGVAEASNSSTYI